MSGNVYTVQFENVAISVVQDLFEILAPSDACLMIMALGFGQTSDVGDAEEEILRSTLRMVSGAPTSGSGGSTPTPRPTNLGAVASGATVEANNTTQLTGGTNVVLQPVALNIRIPEQIIEIPEGRYWISPSTRFLWELESVGGDALSCNGFVKYQEFGG